MTQFAICRIGSKENLSHSIELMPVSGSFYQPIVHMLFGKKLSNDLFIPMYDKQDVDSLCTSAQNVLNSGGSFKSTKLFKFVNELKNNVSELVMWYGDDFSDLEYFCDLHECLKELEESVREPTCESYIHFVKDGLSKNERVRC